MVEGAEERPDQFLLQGHLLLTSWDKAKGSGKIHPVWKKSKGKVRDARWKDIQQFGPNKRRKKRREEGQR